MRKLLVLLFVVMLILFHADAIEPANILSLGLPCFIKFSTFESNSTYNFNILSTTAQRSQSTEQH